jgi:hypothetical protein
MDPDVIVQLNSRLREMSDLLSQQSSVLAVQIQAMNAATGAAKRQATATNELANAETQAGSASESVSKYEESYTRASAMTNQAAKSFGAAADLGKDAALNFVSTMASNVPGMAKYEASVKTATEGLGTALSNFGMLGKAAGAVLGVFGELIGAVFRYNDNITQAYDDVATAGARIGSSPESIMSLGAEAGLASSTIGLLTKGVTSLGTDLRALGLTSSQGVETFGKMIDYGDSSLAGFRKIGLTQEDVIDMTAKYVELQAKAGANMRKPIAELQRESKEYITNLVKQAELQGISAKKQMELQEQALANENYAAYMNQLEYKISQTTDPAEKALLENVRNAKRAMSAKANTYGAEKATTILNAISTDSAVIFDENTAKLQMGGYNLIEMVEGANRGQDQIDAMNRGDLEVARYAAQTFGRQVYEAGQASIDNQDAILFDSETRANAARELSRQNAEGATAQAEVKSQIEAQLAAAMEAEEGIMADIAKIEGKERELRVAIDPLLKKLQELVNSIWTRLPNVQKIVTYVSENFDQITAIVKPLAITLGAIAGGAVAIKVAGDIKNGLSFVKGIFTGGNKPVGSSEKPAYVEISGGGVAGGGRGGGRGGGVEGALTYASANAGSIVKGGAALAGAFALIGGGAAASIWIVSQALPVFANGMKSFNKVNGANLASVGLGLLGISAGATMFAGGAALSMLTALAGKFGVKGPLELAADQLIAFQKLPIDASKVKANGEAALSFAAAIGATLVVGRIAEIVDSMNEFFAKKPPFKDFEDFSKLDIDENKVKINSIAFTEFAKAMSAYTGSNTISTISTALADAVANHLKVPLPLDKFKAFSEITINPEQTKQNATAFKYFSEAMSTYKGTNGGVLDALNELIGSQITKLFDPGGAVKAFQDFSNTPLGPNADKKAAAFFKFATAIGILSGGGTDSSGGVLGSAVSGVAGFISGLVDAVSSQDNSSGSGAARVVEAGAGFTTIQDQSGRIVKRTGVRNWRNNNPGNIQYGDFSRRFGAIGTDGRFAVFPTYDAGKRAKEFLLFESSGYRNLDIARAISRYAPPNENDTNSYINTVARAAGVPSSTPLSSLNTSQRQSMLSSMERVEGFRVGREEVLKAAKGGVFTGPKTGYPMELHGTEIVIPLNQNSVLTKLSQLQHDAKEADSLSSLLGDNTASAKQNTTARLIEIDGEMKEMMLVKLKTVLTVLDSRLNTSKKLLQHMST